MSFEQGDILLINFPYTENSEVKKLRPCLVISNNILNNHHFSNLIVIPITGRPQLDEFSFEISDKSVLLPMPKTSQCRCHMVHIISSKDVQRKVNKVNNETLEQILNKVKSIL